MPERISRREETRLERPVVRDDMVFFGVGLGLGFWGFGGGLFIGVVFRRGLVGLVWLYVFFFV